MIPYQIRQDDGGTSGNSGTAVHQNRLLTRDEPIYEFCCLFKEQFYRLSAHVLDVNTIVFQVGAFIFVWELDFTAATNHSTDALSNQIVSINCSIYATKIQAGND